MSSRVRKLEALLARVEQRRTEQRPLRVVRPAHGGAVAAAAAREPSTAVDTATGSYKPLKDLDRPKVAEISPSGSNGQQVGGLAAAAQIPEGAAPADASPTANRLRPITLPDAEEAAAPPSPNLRVEGATVEASRPVAQIEGEVPAAPAPSFGALIARSLSLKPRG